MVTGIVVTLVAAYLPARKAAKVAPIEALRDTAVESTKPLEACASCSASSSRSPARRSSPGLTGAGAGRSVSVRSPCSSASRSSDRSSPGRSRGSSAHRSRACGAWRARWPGRTRRATRGAPSATASALMIGVALVAFITVFAASAKTSIATSIDKAMKSDWIVDTQFGMGGLSPAVTQRIDALPETGCGHRAALRRREDRRQGEERVGVRPDERRAEHRPRRARRQRSPKLGLHDVAVQADEAKTNNLKLGDTVTMIFAETGVQPLHGRRDLRHEGTAGHVRHLDADIRRQRRRARRQRGVGDERAGCLDEPGPSRNRRSAEGLPDRRRCARRRSSRVRSPTRSTRS